MLNATPVMILGNILPQNGGMTHAVYRRANALANVCARVVIVTFQFHRDFEGLVEWHRQTGNLNRNVEVLNFYEPSMRQDSVRRPAGFRNDWSYFQDGARKGVFRVFDARGRYIRYEERNSWGGFKFVDHFESPWVRVRKSVFDDFGCHRQELYMNRESNVPEFQVTFGRDGRPAVSSRLTKGSPVSYFSHDVGVEFKSEIELVVPWIQGVLKGLHRPVLFIDKREFVGPLRKVGHDGLERVFVLHSSHLEHPFTDREMVSTSMGDALQALSRGEIARMVVLTEEQFQDLSHRPELAGRVRAIPHFQEPKEGGDPSYDRNLIVSLARYHSAKNLDDALEIVAEVRKHVPDVKYEVYGYGPELKRLEKRVLDMKLERNVSLLGHTNEPDSKIRRAALMLFTSKHEGMGLAPMESLASGTPVVSFDPKYGPREVVRDGVDGFLVSRDSMHPIVDAAERVVQILLDPHLRERLSQRAVEVSERFSEAKFRAAWVDLFSELTRDRKSAEHGASHGQQHPVERSSQSGELE